MNPHLSVITLAVNNLQEARQFYENGLCLSPSKEFNDFAMYRLGDIYLGLYPREKMAADIGIEDGDISFPSMTLAHYVKSDTEVDSLMEEAVRAGAALIKPAQKTDWGGYAGYFADPDGHYWEVAWNPFF